MERFEQFGVFDYRYYVVLSSMRFEVPVVSSQTIVANHIVDIGTYFFKVDGRPYLLVPVAARPLLRRIAQSSTQILHEGSRRMNNEKHKKS